MIVVRDADGEELWDASANNTLVLFGSHGGGKTILARHIALKWAEAGGTVVAGHKHEHEYGDLYPTIHMLGERKTSLDASVEYGRLMDTDSSGHGLLIIVDDAVALKDHNKTYLHDRVRSNVTWVVLSLSPRLKWKTDAAHIGLGRLRQKDARAAFGWSESSRVPLLNTKGVAVRSLPGGAVVRQQVGSESMYGTVRERGELPFKNPLPSVQRRSLYGGVQ